MTMLQNLIFLTIALGAVVYFFVMPKLTAGGEDFKPEVSFELVKQGAVLIDVRSKGEYDSGHVKEAVNIPHTEIKEKKDLIKQLTGANKKKPIVVYCQSGGRSSIAQKTLQELGYTRVTNHGGIGTWKKSEKKNEK